MTRFPHHVAVLAALTLLAGMLAAAPAVGDEHPEADYTATFSACEGVPASGFEDVPEDHASAGSIDCIAYYNITRGTSMTTYSPLMSVTREHMALFLIRLASRVGIEVTDTPDDAGFTDIGDLSEGSQLAINQLADLDITSGTSDTTYSPGDAVRRDHMALFIARLMDKMDPFADPNAAGGAAPFAYIPEDVVAVNAEDDDDDIAVMSPFNDLGLTTKKAYDAITALWELGVASGVSDTAYAPAALITRAAMADFMAGVLDHSNARPAGVTMQVNKTTDFGEVTAVRAISVRDDSFAPMGDVSVKVFTATDSGGIDDDTGKCLTDDACGWSDNDEITDADGNNFDSIDVATDDGDGGTGNMENSETWYAWMGDEDNSEFVKGESGEASVTLTAKAEALGIRVTADINEEATNNWVDVGKDTTVVLTAQLIAVASDADNADDADAVAKEGVSLSITRTRDGVTDAPGPDAMKTDADGKVTFTIEGPEEPDDGALFRRVDTVTFTGDVDGDTTDETANLGVWWTNADAAVTKGETDAPTYVIINDDEVSVRVTVSYYDQFGNSAATGDRLTITVDNPDDTTEDGMDTTGTNGARVRSNGTARFTATLNAAAGAELTVTVSALQTATGVDADDRSGDTAILAVRHAHKNDDGVTSTADNLTADTDNDRFIIDGATDTTAGVLYSYDSGDTFIVDDATVDMDAFEEALDATGTTVEVVFYRADGMSIFSVTTA
ncbi:MAG: S-layer homology domain-containing protein [Actinomycetia bacterium]|nr:S-layer homology domain-containing protein [Actinomycetes bacterium]